MAIVTGGGSGIGGATASLLARDGARVVVADVDAAAAERVACAVGGDARTVDVADRAQVDALVASVVREAGRVDVLVSNAFATAVGPLVDLPPAGWQRTLDVTLSAVFYGLQAVAPVMRRQGGGAVVHLASVSGLGGDRGLAAYNAAKAGVVNLTRTAALELAAWGIRVNAVAPGLIATPALQRALDRSPALPERARAAVPLGRLGTPDDVARTIAFLASDDAAYVTGATLVVDGGLSVGSGVPDFGG